MARLELYLLGDPRVLVDGAPVTFARNKVLALIVYLAMTGQRHSRDSLAELLFPGDDRSHAQSSLRQTLSFAGAAIRKDTIRADRRSVWLADGHELVVDVAEYRRLLGAARSAERGHKPSKMHADLEKAAALYRGRFLDGFYLRNAPSFEEWQLREEENLRLEQLYVLERLVRIHAAAGEYEQAIEKAGRWAALEPSEEAHRQLMRLHAQLGQWSMALQQFDRCREMTRREFGADPEQETRTLYEQVAARRIAPEAPMAAATHLHGSGHRGPVPAEGHGVWLFAAAGTSRVCAMASAEGVASAGTPDDLPRLLATIPPGSPACAPCPSIAEAIAAAARIQGSRRCSLRIVLVAAPTATQASVPSDLPARRALVLLDAAHPGQVLVTAEAAALARGLSIEGSALIALGALRLRDLGPALAVYQLVHPDLQADYPPLLTLDSVPNNLRSQPTALLGRQREIAALEACLMEPGVRLLTLTGPAGTGKTRLALHAAAAAVGGFPHGVFLVDLSSLRKPEHVLPAVAAALEVRDPEGAARPPAVAVREHLQGRRLLLVLDNFEHLLPAGVEISELLAACPECIAMGTSREPLRVRDERIFEVPALGLPRPGARHPDEIDCDAVRLLVERGRAVQPGFAVTRSNAAAVAAVCRQLDGLPLALELAASQLRNLSVEELERRLQRRLSVLVDGWADLPARQRALRSTLDWSHSLLPEAGQRLFAQLSVFAGGFALEAAEDVCAGGAGKTPDVLQGVTSLAGKSLLVREEVGGAVRFRMLETVGEYARERLGDGVEASELRLRHAGYYLRFAESARPLLHGAAQIEWLDRLEAEMQNLRAARVSLFEHGPESELLRLATSLEEYWYRRSLFREGIEWFDEALDRADPAPSRERAEALYGLGRLRYYAGEWSVARDILARCRSLARECALRDVESVALGYQAIAERSLGQAARAAGHADEALRIARTSDDPRHVAFNLLLRYATTGGRQSDLSTLGELHEALRIFRSVGDSWGAAHVLDGLGDVYRELCAYPEARQRYEEALFEFLALGDRWMAAWAHAGLASVHQREQRPDDACASFCAALAIFHSLGDAANTLSMLHKLGMLSHVQGEQDRAARILGGYGSHLRGLNGRTRELDAATEAACRECQAGFRRDWALGQAMSLPDVVDYALQREGLLSRPGRSG